MHVDVNQKKDNKTALISNDVQQKVVFTNTNVGYAIVSFERRSFGDNFMVAVHPNVNAVDMYRFKDTGDKTLEHPDGDGYEELDEEMQISVGNGKVFHVRFRISMLP